MQTHTRAQAKCLNIVTRVHAVFTRAAPKQNPTHTRSHMQGTPYVRGDYAMMTTTTAAAATAKRRHIDVNVSMCRRTRKHIMLSLRAHASLCREPQTVLWQMRSSCEWRHSASEARACVRSTRRVSSVCVRQYILSGLSRRRHHTTRERLIIARARALRVNSDDTVICFVGNGRVDMCFRARSLAPHAIARRSCLYSNNYQVKYSINERARLGSDGISTRTRTFNIRHQV